MLNRVQILAGCQSCLHEPSSRSLRSASTLSCPGYGDQRSFQNLFSGGPLTSKISMTSHSPSTSSGLIQSSAHWTYGQCFWCPIFFAIEASGLPHPSHLNFSPNCSISRSCRARLRVTGRVVQYRRRGLAEANRYAPRHWPPQGRWHLPLQYPEASPSLLGGSLSCPWLPSLTDGQDIVGGGSRTTLAEANRYAPRHWHHPS